jgi:pyrimidine oxygenase
MSARGFDFSVREADGCFIGGRDAAETGAASRRAKALAASLGKTIRTYCMMTVIAAPTDEEAQVRAQKYRDGLDEGAVAGMLESYGVQGNAMTARAQGAFMTQVVVGSPASCARQIEAFLRDCEIDGLMFIYDDYLAGLRVTGQEILPHLRAVFA